MRKALIALGLCCALGACDPRDPVAEEANAINEPADVGVLPPDESVATPTNELQNGVTNAASADGSSPIPASLQGRWALTPEDCRRPIGGSEGGLRVTGNELRFYESVARPVGDLETSANSIRGDFAFTGEGSRWTRHLALELQDDKLVRTESGPTASFTYARCAS